MIEDGTYTATLDRIEEEIAVLLIEQDGDVIEEFQIHDLETLPDESRHDGAVLRVSIKDGDVVDIEYDRDAEEERRTEMQERFEQLSEQPPGRDTDR